MGIDVLDKINGYPANVKMYGAVGDGVTDDTAAIQAALDAAFIAGGGPVVVPPAPLGYGITSPIKIKRGCQLVGCQLGFWKIGDDSQTCFLKVLSGFSGSAAILIEDATLLSAASDTSMIAIKGIGIDGNSIGSIHGIHLRGHIRNIHFDEIDIRRPGGHGVYFEEVSSRRSQELYANRMFIHGCGQKGFYSDDLVDGRIIDSHISDCAGHGFHFKSLSNFGLIGCSSEHNTAGSGYYFENGTTYTPGNVEMTGCTTDRNEQHGCYWGARSSQNNRALVLTGCRFRRDGRNGNSGGGSFAGLMVEGASGNPALPVLISNMSQNVGVDDDGSGTNSPQYGLSATYALHIQITGGQLWGTTGAWNDGGNNTTIHFSPGVRQISGAFTSPTSSVKWVYLPTGAILATGTDAATYVDVPEQSTTPGAPSTNTARLFVRDSGAGKTELRARFNTGATQLIAVEP